VTTPALTPPAVLVTDHLRLLPLGPPLAGALARYRDANRKHLAGSAPPTPEGAALLEWARSAAAQAEREWAEDRSVCFVLVPREPASADALAGHVMFTQIIRGPFQACYLGFGLDQNHVGQGMMKEALAEAIRFMFNEKRLHRIMANHMPTNHRSARTLRSLGFVPEGYARDYLFLGGAWQDHVLTALTNPSPLPPK